MRRDLDILFFVIISLFVLVIFFIMTLGTPSEEVRKPIIIPKCTEGTNMSCTLGTCTGYRVCESGEWSECRFERICVPGSVAPCIENYCAVGYKTCNECGTGYGECIGLNES